MPVRSGAIDLPWRSEGDNVGDDDAVRAPFRLDEGEQPAVDAATVMLLRDGPTGIETFMLERHLDSDFAGGALVFPGGKVDQRDRDFPLDGWIGCDAVTAMAELGTSSEQAAVALYIAAVRETFEEAGVLLASRGLDPVTLDDLRSPSYVEARRRLSDRDDDFDWRPWLREEGLTLALGALAFAAWWTTPAGSHKRFDTRFFWARAPAAQQDALAPNDVEVVTGAWMSPSEAVAAGAAGQASVIYPTRRNLQAL
jgi:8-oxo-dGTP pyrophosphatase MutT (NUDIX family)